MPESIKAFKQRKESRHSYGWVPDLPDHRDYLYWSVRSAPRVLPVRVDLRRLCSEVEDQGDLGSCTANALAGALEYLEKKDKVPCADLSRLFIYYNERVIEHSVQSDSGAMIRDGIKTLAKQGVCAEKRWPYVISQFAKKPSPASYREASDHQITSYHRIRTPVRCAPALPKVFPSSLVSQFMKASSPGKLQRPAS